MYFHIVIDTKIYSCDSIMIQPIRSLHQEQSDTTVDFSNHEGGFYFKTKGFQPQVKGYINC